MNRTTKRVIGLGLFVLMTIGAIYMLYSGYSSGEVRCPAFRCHSVASKGATPNTYLIFMAIWGIYVLVAAFMSVITAFQLARQPD